MKKTSLLLIAIAIFSVIISTGCRKEDASPVYNYYGPSAVGGGDSGSDEDLSAEGDATNINYNEIQVDCNIPSGLKGFVTSDSDLDEFWMQQCQGTGAEPNIDFDKEFLAFYAAELNGCAEMKIKKIGMVDDKIVIGLIKLMPPAGCSCTKNPYIKRFFITIDQVMDTTPKFAIYAGDRECTPAE